MKICNSFSSSKRSVKELVESTWYKPYKRIKTRRYANVLFFTTTTSILETWKHQYTCQIIVIASSVETIPQECFTDFSYLDTVIFQKESLLKEINDGAFQNCKKLTSIYLPSKLTHIGKFAFDGCTSLKAASIPKSVYYIGAFAFSGCKSLTDISLPISVSYIGHYAFSNCAGLKKFLIPPAIKRIRKGTFEKCSNLITMFIPPSVSSIEDYAFEECHSLRSMTLLPSLTSIGRRVFNNCKELKVLHVPSTNNVIAPQYSFLLEYPACSRNFDDHLIILADENKSLHNEIWEPVMILHDIHYACLYGLEKKLDQMKELYNVFHKFFPIPASFADAVGMNLLHILVHFPSNSINILDIMQELLEKCPTAATSMDCDGRTPLHHLIEFNSRRDSLMEALLLKYCDNTILHKALKSKSPSWNVMENIIRADGIYGIGDVISAIDESSGFLPFMTAALGCNSNLTTVFKLLQMKPDLLVNL